MEKKFTIVDKLGLHARPCSVLVSTAGRFAGCTVKIQKGATAVDLKSILGVMSLGVKHNEEVTIICDGENAADAMAAIEKIMTDQKLI